MSESWPETGELVIATVRRIAPYGAYVSLDEYDREGLVHISEISSGWVRHIRDYLREGQKVVLKVLRVDPVKEVVDLSLKRVSDSERRAKLIEWKKVRKAESILLTLAESGLGSREIEEVRGAIESEYEGLYEGLEAASEEGESALIRAGVPIEIARKLAAIAKDRIKIPKVKIKALLTLKCLRPSGMEVIKDALLKGLKHKRKGVDVKIYAVGAPRYCVEVVSRNPKLAEAIMKEVSEDVVREVMARGGEGSFERVEE